MIGKLLCASALAFAPLAYSNEITLKSDPDAKYSIVEIDGSTSNPLVSAKRVGVITSYTRHQFDCENRRVRFMGRGASLTDLSVPDNEETPIFKGSLASVIAEEVCKTG